MTGVYCTQPCTDQGHRITCKGAAETADIVNKRLGIEHERDGVSPYLPPGSMALVMEGS